MTDNKLSSLAIDVASEKYLEDTDRVMLSTGVVLHVTPVSSLIFAEIQKRNKMPRPPIVFIEANGRDEENPNDPTYLQSKSDWEVLMANAMVDVMILRGTEIEFIADGFPRPESTEWSDDFSLAGVDIPVTTRARYLAYIKYVAASKGEDLNKIMSAVSRLSGVSEEDVDAASKQFRSDK